MEAVLTLTDNMTGNFRRAANQTTAISRSTTQQITAMNQGVNRMLRVGAMATVAAIGATSAAVIKITNDVATMGDELAKTGRQIGWTAEGLQEMRFAADRQGVSADTLTSSLEKLNKNVGDLRANTGSLRTILNQTNPALAEQLMNVENNEEAFNLLVSEIGALPNQMDRAALAQAAFGRAGQDMLKLIEAGPEGIAALRAEAREYGLITNEGAAASEAYVDAMTNLKAVWAGAKTELASGLIPRATEMLTKLKDFLMANREIISQNINKFLDNMSEGFKDAIPFLKATWEIIQGLVAAFIRFKPAIKFAVIWFGAYIALVKAFMAFQVAKSVFVAVRAFMALAKAQGVLNAVMAMNPIGLIIIAIAALIAAIILMVKHWDVVKEKIMIVWDWLSRMLDNPFFTAAATIMAPWLAIPAMIIKHWEPIKTFFLGLWEIIKGIVEAFQSDGLRGLADLQNQVPEGSAREAREARQQSRRERRNGASVAEQERIVTQERIQEESRQRNDIYLHAPIGAGISDTPGGAPSQAVNLGAQ